VRRLVDTERSPHPDRATGSGPVHLDGQRSKMDLSLCRCGPDFEEALS
jgi:hypothetical protein